MYALVIIALVVSFTLYYFKLFYIDVVVVSTLNSLYLSSNCRLGSFYYIYITCKSFYLMLENLKQELFLVLRKDIHT